MRGGIVCTRGLDAVFLVRNGLFLGIIWLVGLLELSSRNIWNRHRRICDVRFIVRGRFIFWGWCKRVLELQLWLLSTDRGTDFMYKLRSGRFRNGHWSIILHIRLSVIVLGRLFFGLWCRKLHELQCWDLHYE